MPTQTTYYGFQKPNVNDPTDQDLWGGYLNMDLDSIDSIIHSLTIVPSGMISPFAGSAAPSGWFLCYGQAISRSTYATLFSAISTTYGAGDGSTTFNIPDLRGRSAIGLDNMGGSSASRITTIASSLGANGGSEFLQSHTHGITDPGHTHTYNNIASTSIGGGTTPVATGSPGPNGTQINLQSATTGIAVQYSGAGNSQNLQPMMFLNYIIKT